MSPEPIRHEPGPRDWTPVGWDSEPNVQPRARLRPTRSGTVAGALTAMILGVVAVGVGAFATPNSNSSNTVILSTIGLLAVIVGVVTWPRASTGASWRRALATVGIALGALALTSTVSTVAHSTWETTFPTLHDATREALQAQSDQQSAAPVVQAPIPNSDVSIATAEDERVYLTEVLTRASALIDRVATDDSLPVLATSTASYPHMTTEGLIAIGSIDHFDAAYSAGPSGGYLLMVTGYAFGTVAQFDSSTGTITLR